MHWPQITMIVFGGISLGMALAKNGEPKTEPHSAVWTTVALAVEFVVLYAGGFFG